MYNCIAISYSVNTNLNIVWYAVTYQKPTQRWRDTPDRGGGMLPGAVVDDLMQRDLSDQDYELLLQLDKLASY